MAIQYEPPPKGTAWREASLQVETWGQPSKVPTQVMRCRISGTVGGHDVHVLGLGATVQQAIADAMAEVAEQLDPPQ